MNISEAEEREHLYVTEFAREFPRVHATLIAFDETFDAAVAAFQRSVAAQPGQATLFLIARRLTRSASLACMRLRLLEAMILLRPAIEATADIYLIDRHPDLDALWQRGFEQSSIRRRFENRRFSHDERASQLGAVWGDFSATASHPNMALGFGRLTLRPGEEFWITELHDFDQSRREVDLLLLFNVTAILLCLETYDRCFGSALERDAMWTNRLAAAKLLSRAVFAERQGDIDSWLNRPDLP